MWPAQHSQIYPALAQLADRGWVTVGEEGSRGRREYAITEAGRTELRRWLLDEPAESARRHEDLLRIFFYPTLDADEAEALLRHEFERGRTYGLRLSELYAAIPWDDSDSDLYGALVLEQGRMWAKMRMDWAAWALEQVAAKRGAATLAGRLDDSVFAGDGESS